jgi:hypothetical protein
MGHWSQREKSLILYWQDAIGSFFLKKKGEKRASNQVKPLLFPARRIAFSAAA